MTVPEFRSNRCRHAPWCLTHLRPDDAVVQILAGPALVAHLDAPVYRDAPLFDPHESPLSVIGRAS